MQQLRLLALAGILVALTRCGQPESPAPLGTPTVSGPPFFTATLDGAAWVADSVHSIVLTPSAGGVATLIVANRRVSPKESHTIMLGFPSLPTPGPWALGDIVSPAVGFFTIDTTGESSPAFYYSNNAHPGHLSIDGVNSSDSLLAGSFSFDASRFPDTSAHRMLSGQFRVRYTHPAF